MNLYWLEAIVTAAALLAALSMPRLGESLFRRIESTFYKLARRPIAAPIAVGLTALALRLALLPILGIAEPSRHDEFSNLLAADTFSKGRLTNPTHPMWIHFETFHVNHQPTYMSMYPPAQGIVLAGGKLLFGHPWFGGWAAGGLLCGLMTWMLRAWVPPGWALLGGLLAILRTTLFSYWTNTYFGGAAPAMGGILILGVLGRTKRFPSAAGGALAALGAMILANSRPYEGFYYCLTSVGFLAWMWKRRNSCREWRRCFLQRFVPAGLLILAIGGLAMAYYNWRLFGNPLTLPYETNRATYAVALIIFWQAPRPIPNYRHAVMRDFFVGWEMRVFRRVTSEHGALLRIVTYVARFWLFYIGPLLTVPLLLAGPALFRDRRIRAPMLLFASVAAAVATLNFVMAHYFAAAIGAFYVLLMQSFRHMRARLDRPSRRGHALVRSFVTAAVFLAVLRPTWIAETGAPLGATWFSPESMFRGRQSMIQELLGQPGRDLVLVRYGPGHDPFFEWVFNEADIDNAGVVWAREMDEASDRLLINYFRQRRVWLLEPDVIPPRLSPHPRSTP